MTFLDVRFETNYDDIECLFVCIRLNRGLRSHLGKVPALKFDLFILLKKHISLAIYFLHQNDLRCSFTMKLETIKDF